MSVVRTGGPSENQVAFQGGERKSQSVDNLSKLALDVIATELKISEGSITSDEMDNVLHRIADVIDSWTYFRKSCDQKSGANLARQKIKSKKVCVEDMAWDHERLSRDSSTSKAKVNSSLISPRTKNWAACARLFWGADPQRVIAHVCRLLSLSLDRIEKFQMGSSVSDASFHFRMYDNDQDELLASEDDIYCVIHRMDDEVLCDFDRVI